ncbi:MAG: hypothetical protein WCJ56_05310, partial [bacterium]
DTTAGVTIRKRCVAQPTEKQAILLQQLKIKLPAHYSITDKPANVVTQIGIKNKKLSVKGSKTSL